MIKFTKELKKPTPLFYGFNNEPTNNLHLTNDHLLSLPTISYAATVDYRKTYRVNISIQSSVDIPNLLIFSEQRQLRFISNIFSGQNYQFSFYTSLTEIIPFQSNERMTINQLFITICGHNLDSANIDCYAEEIKKSRIFLCGDSTVANQTTSLPYYPALSYCSWGQTLSAFIDSEFAVDNLAISGQTSESFFKDGLFDIALEYMAPNDICLLQFGHNDQKIPHLLPKNDYYHNIVKMCQLIKEKKARPVLVTPLARNTWKNENDYLDLLNEYDEIINSIGQEYQLPVIQLHQYSVNYWQKLGLENSRDYFPFNDYTHTNDYGAYLFSRYIGDQLSLIFPKEIHYRQLPEILPPHDTWSSVTLDENILVSDENTTPTPNNIELHKMEFSIKNLIETIENAKKGSDID